MAATIQLNELATQLSNVEKQINAMFTSYMDHMRKESWKLVKAPKGAKIHDSVWSFTETGGTIRATLAIKGHEPSSSPTIPHAKLMDLFLVLASASKDNLAVSRVYVAEDAVIASIKEQIYMKQPKGFVDQSRKEMVCRILKSIPGVKSSPMSGSALLQEALFNAGFDECIEGVYVYHDWDDYETDQVRIYALMGENEILVVGEPIAQSDMIDTIIAVGNCDGAIEREDGQSKFMGIEMHSKDGSRFALKNTRLMNEFLQNYKTDRPKAIEAAIQMSLTVRPDLIAFNPMSLRKSKSPVDNHLLLIYAYLKNSFKKSLSFATLAFELSKVLFGC